MAQTVTRSRDAGNNTKSPAFNASVVSPWVNSSRPRTIPSVATSPLSLASAIERGRRVPTLTRSECGDTQSAEARYAFGPPSFGAADSFFPSAKVMVRAPATFGSLFAR